MPTQDTPRGVIHYRDYRKTPEATPLLLIHGAGGTHLHWPAQVRRGLEAVALDLPGHGASQGPGRESVVEYAADVAAFMEALALSPAAVAGHSLGGAIALQLALEYPALVEKLALVGTGARLRVSDAILDGIQQDPEKTAQIIADWSWSAQSSAEARTQMAQHLLETPVAVTHGDFVACNAFDVRERLSELNVPTLVLYGTEDKMIPDRYNAPLREDIPGAKAITVTGGHMFPLEQPDTVAALMQEWLHADG